MAEPPRTLKGWALSKCKSENEPMSHRFSESEDATAKKMETAAVPAQGTHFVFFVVVIAVVFVVVRWTFLGRESGAPNGRFLPTLE